VDVDVAITKVLVEIVSPAVRSLAIGRSHESFAHQGLHVFLTLADMHLRRERSGEQLRQTVRHLGPIRLAGDPHLAVPFVLEKPFGGSPANLQIWRAVRLPIYIARDHRAPRFGRTVAFLVLARRAAGFLLRKLRQSELPPYMIATRDRIVAGEAMHHETVRRSAVALDRKRTIFGGVSRPRHERFAVG
jgi:hypothetical protein